MLGVNGPVKRRIIAPNESVVATGLLIWGERYQGTRMIMKVGYNTVDVLYQKIATDTPPVSVNGYVIKNNGDKFLFLLDFYDAAATS